MTMRRDWVGLEIPAVLAILVGGAVLRYWLSTVVPFNASELALLSEASVRDRAGRVPFIMLNGISLGMLYLAARRSAGVAVAFVLLLGIQTSIAFQEQALRIRWFNVAILVGMLGLAYWRSTQPAWQAPRTVAVAATVLATLFAVRGAYLGITLPARLEMIRHETTGDVDALYASLIACGGGDITPLEKLRSCRLVWPTQRSLNQQEALLAHAQTLGTEASILDGGTPFPEPPERDDQYVAILDRSGAAFFVVTRGEREGVARRVLGVAP